jgi:hypothetical protein
MRKSAAVVTIFLSSELGVGSSKLGVGLPAQFTQSLLAAESGGRRLSELNVERWTACSRRLSELDVFFVSSVLQPSPSLPMDKLAVARRIRPTSSVERLSIEQCPSLIPGAQVSEALTLPSPSGRGGRRQPPVRERS